MGRGDNAHVHPDRHLATDAVELALGKNTQQACLQRGRHVADFVEEQGSAVGLFKAANAARIRACKRAFLVAEQLGLEKL